VFKLLKATQSVILGIELWHATLIWTNIPPTIFKLYHSVHNTFYPKLPLLIQLELSLVLNASNHIFWMNNQNYA